MNVQIDISNTLLRTERLILRPWKQSDLDDFFAYASVDGVGQMAGWLPHETKEVSQMILDLFIEGKRTFALEYQGKVIGSIGIEEYVEAELPECQNFQGREIGYVLSKEYWGQGLMPEAVRKVIDYLFDEVHLDFIACGYFLRNQQSARVQEKCGFSFVKEVVHTTGYGTKEATNLNILWEKDDCEKNRSHRICI